jgi:hypothetical protein
VGDGVKVGSGVSVGRVTVGVCVGASTTGVLTAGWLQADRKTKTRIRNKRLERFI